MIDLEASDDTVDQSAVGHSTAVSSRPGSCVEPVSPVIGKYLQKATTAPPTIRHFFKPKQPENGSVATSSENEPERPADDASADPDDNQILDVDDDDDIVITEISERRQLSDKPDCSSHELAVPRTQGNGCKTAAGSKSVTKRSSSGKLPAGKKAKQSSIQALFSSAARNPPKQLGTMQCPICSRWFDEAVSNADVNLHIDSCLIE